MFVLTTHLNVLIQNKLCHPFDNSQSYILKMGLGKIWVGGDLLLLLLHLLELGLSLILEKIILIFIAWTKQMSFFWGGALQT